MSAWEIVGRCAVFAVGLWPGGYGVLLWVEAVKR